MRFKAGDVVQHGPSGETWVLAAADYQLGEVYPCGWPETIAKAADCTLVRSETDEKSKEMTEKWAKYDTPDVRRVAAKCTFNRIRGVKG